MARTRKSALDSVLDEIQEQAQPSLQEMLKARAEAERDENEAEGPMEDAPAETPEGQVPQDGKPGMTIGEILFDGDGDAPEKMGEAPVEEDAPVTEMEVAVVEEPVKAVTIEEQYQELKLTPKEKDMVLDGRLREILGVPKARTAVPTLVRYRQDGQLALRGVIIDIGEYELTEGWNLYKSQVDGATPEKYLLKVYELTQTEIPRMYRTVGEMRLE